ncbi:MAG: DUF6017 domain-containing protein [Clostridia bacterium]|nr:DUF6017 domain-containing protein [Clostridia bacterium]
MNSSNPENGIQDFRKSECNNTNIINTEFSDINLNITNQTIPNNCKEVSRVDKVELYEKYFEVIKKNIDYDYLVSLKHFCPSEVHRINEILNIITDMVVFNDKPVLINSINYPPEIIKSVFMKLNSRNILYVLNSLDESKAEIKNIKKYIISMLYNSRFSIENYNTVKDNLEYC